mgnify:CR=1 FL=1
MKKTFTGIITLISVLGFGQNTKLEEAVKEQIQSLKQMSKLQSISIGVGGEKEDDELDSFSFENYTTYSPSFFDSLEIKQQRDFPYTFLEVKYNKYKLSEMLGEDNFYFGENSDKMPEFIPKTVKFFNGKNADAKDIFIQNKELERLRKKDNDIDEIFTSSFYYNTDFVLKTVQPIESVNFLLKTNFDEMKEYFADKNTTVITTDEGEIRVSEFIKNQVTITYPKAMENHFNVYGIHKNGKYLREKGKSSKSSTYTQEQISEITKALTNALSEIKSNKISTEKELKKFLENNISKEIVTPKEPATATTVYYFAGNLEKIKIGQKKSGGKKTERTVTYFTSNYYKEKYTKNPNIVCTDRETGKYGIIDLSGNWIIKPEYTGLAETGNANYFEIENEENWYRLDLNQKKLIKVDYEIKYKSEKNKDGNTIAKHNVSKKYGVVEELSGKTIISFEYDDLKVINDEFLRAKKNVNGKNLEGIINYKNQIIIPIEHEYVKWIEPFFVVSANTSAETQDLIYDKTGKLLTSKYRIVGNHSSTEKKALLLVETYTPKKEPEVYKYKNWVKFYPKNVETTALYFYHFLDENGNIKFSIDMDEYQRVEEFHNGLATIVKHNGKMGYIDTSGKLAIPTIFEKAIGSNFYGKYALVEKDEEYWFIDKEGKLIKQVDDSPRYGDGKIIRLYNGDVYNHDGERLEEGKNKQPKKEEVIYHLPVN